MYKTSVPIAILSKKYNFERTLQNLKNAHAGRIFLTIDAIAFNDENRQTAFNKLRQEIIRFKANGIETGVWLWAFMVRDKNPFTPIMGFDKKSSALQRCPLDKNFMHFAAENIKDVARMKPDLIMFDDDLRFAFLDSGFGCCCENHLDALSMALGEDVKTEGLFEKLFSGRKNRYRSAWLKVHGDSIKSFCIQMRKSVDEIDSNIRLGSCSVMSNWDTDGVDSFTISKLLAGDTKPFLRLIGAPYWAENKSWGNRLQDVIELERMERSWYSQNDIEIFSEGDTCPRPRYRVPASYLEIFDTALRASGEMDGIHKYMFDYTSSADYERGYLDRHIENIPLGKQIDELFSDKCAYGIRIYESMNKLEDADFTDKKVDLEYVPNMFFSHSARMLAANSIPSTYRGAGCAGIAFGENARHLPQEAYDRPLIIDISAAKILSDKGIDTGIEGFGEKCVPTYEYYHDFDEYVRIYDTSDFACKIVPKPGAQALSEFETAAGNVPSCIVYTNKNGQRFITYTFEADFASESVTRNYCRPKQLSLALESFDCTLPAVSLGNPDLYMLCKKGENDMAIGLWNCSADFAQNVDIILNEEYGNIEFINCTGTLKGKNIIIDRIMAYDFCFVHVWK